MRLRASVVTSIHEYRGCEEAWLESMRTQTACSDEFEVILVNSSKYSEYERFINQLANGTGPSISYHRLSPRGRAESLNQALDLAKGEVIIFLTDDFVAPPHFVATHLLFHRNHAESEAVAIGSAIIPAEQSSPFAAWLERSGKFFGVPFTAEMASVPEDFFYVGNASVKRALIDRAGRFNEKFGEHAWDDFEFGQRLLAAGMKATYLADALAVHVHPIALRERERAMRFAGAAAKVYLSIYPGNYEWRDALEASSLYHWFRRANTRARMLFSKSDAAVEDWWTSRLDAAFAKGYREGFTE